MTSVEITVPESWSDVKLKTFQELISSEITNDIKGHVKRTSILCDADSDTVSKLPIAEFKKLNDSLSWSNKLPTEDYQYVFELEGQKYGLIKLSDVTVGEYTDLEFNVGEGLIPNLHNILAILYRPLEWMHDDYVKMPTKWKREHDYYKTQKYDSETVSSRAELFKEKLDVSRVYTAALFFYHFVDRFLKNMQHSLKEELMQEMQEILTKLEGRLQEKESVG